MVFSSDEGLSREKRYHLDVVHHFPDGIPVTFSGSLSIGGVLQVTLVEPIPPPLPATHAILIVTPTQGEKMPGTITVDTTNETATVEFVDDKGDTNAPEPVAASGSALVVTFASDNTAVASVAADSANPLQGDVTPVGEGTANISATLAYADGTPVVEADGVTPFPVPAPVAVTVGPGAAVGDAFVLSV